MKRRLKCFGLLLLPCMLCSCWRSSAIHESIDVINNSINALEQSLPKECKTKSIQLQIDGLKKETIVIETRCNEAVDKVTSEKIKWQTGFFGLLLIIGLWLSRKIIFR